MTAHGRRSDGFSSAHHSSALHSVAANLGVSSFQGQARVHNRPSKV